MRGQRELTSCIRGSWRARVGNTSRARGRCRRRHCRASPQTGRGAPAADEQRVIVVVPVHNIFAHTKVSWRLPVCHRSYTECREDFESGGVRQLTLVSQQALYG